MSLPVDIDEYTRYIVLNDKELAELKVNPSTHERVRRLRGIYFYWLKFPDKFDNEIVHFDMEMFGVEKRQAYDDVHLVQVLLGNIQSGNKEFMRWKINKDLEEDLRQARRVQDFRAIAAIEKNRILNNRTDKNDEVELEFDKIVPQVFEPTDDPTVIGVEKIPRLRERIRQLNKKYASGVETDYTDFEEVEDGAGEE